jgi:hypothetical protein
VVVSTTPPPPTDHLQVVVTSTPAWRRVRATYFASKVDTQPRWSAAHALRRGTEEAMRDTLAAQAASACPVVSTVSIAERRADAC